MKFNEIIIKTNSFGSEFLAGELIVNGVISFSIDDPKDFIGIVEEKSVPFDYYDASLIPEDTETVTVTVYLTDNDQGESRRKFVLDTVSSMRGNSDYGDMSVTFGCTDDRDWENSWKEFFHPLPIGDKLMIKPSWEECDAGNRVVLEIDPESSFGSGRHETTKLCLEQLEKHPLEGKNILDMGCGSGILGIAACLLSARHAVCVDIEENAIEITKKNAVINRIGDGILEAFVGNILTDAGLLGKINRKYDLIISNIVADVLAEMMPLFASMLVPGGSVILSGIISMREKTVTDSLAANGFVINEIRRENDWICIDARLA